MVQNEVSYAVHDWLDSGGGEIRGRLEIDIVEQFYEFFFFFFPLQSKDEINLI